MKAILILLILLTWSTYAFSVDRVVGCYELSLSPWTPVMDLQGDNVYLTVPNVIRLTTEKEQHGGFLILPANGAKQSVHRFAYWNRQNSLLHLVLTNGFSGVSMTLEETVSGLKGHADSFWDFGRKSQTSSLVAKSVPCSPGTSDSPTSTAH